MSDLTELRALAARKRWTPDTARRLNDAWRAHGGPLAEFARAIDCQYERLRRWTHLLDNPQQPPPVHFIELTRPPSHPLEVIVDGITIRVPPDFDPTTLRRLIATLAPC